MTHGKSLDEIMAKLPEPRQRRIRVRANALIAEYARLKQEEAELKTQKTGDQ